MKYKDSSLPIEERVKDLLSRMTLDEKIGQLHQVSGGRTNAVEVRELARQGRAGSRIMGSTAYAGNEKQDLVGVAEGNETQRIAVEESRLGIPLITGKDIVHGHHTIFPIPLAQAASWEPELIECAADMAAQEAAEDGIQWTFAPMLDIARDPRWGRIIEGFGEDPYLCSEMAKAAVKGFQGNKLAEHGNIAACAKHFIAYGLSEGGRDYNVCDCSENALLNTYLPPFKAAVEQGVATVMASFNEIGGVPASGSHHLLTELLKDKLGFEGFVVSDWYAVQQLINQGTAKSRKEAAKQAFSAGLDMNMADGCYIDHMKELVEEGQVSMERLDDAVRRILTIKFKLGLFERPYTEFSECSILAPEHLKFARTAASKCMVLLKNQGGILPLPKRGKKIALIGPFAHTKCPFMGSWMSDGNEKDVVSIAEGIRAVAPDADVVESSELFDEMLIAVRKADVVIIALGESHMRTGEHSSVAELNLPAGQTELLEAANRFGKPIVAVICAGRPLAISEVDRLADAVLYAWHPGTQGGLAVADVLFGDVNPSGKLPVTFPRNAGQIPIYYNYKPNPRLADEYYGKGHTEYYDHLARPLYPFGYGLSYSAFTYDDIKIDKSKIDHKDSVEVSVRVTNTGNYDGEEVVQCYIRDMFSSVTRPVRELKGFQKIRLQKGESCRVSFRLGSKELSFYNRNGSFCLESGEFTVWMGGSCLAELHMSFEVV